MAEGKLVVCPQCGKKYKLKEGFDSASFSCKACGATVWVEGKPKVAPSTRRKGAPSRAGGGGARRARGGGRARAAPTARGRGRREEAGEEEEGRQARGRYQHKSSPTNMILAVVGLVVLGVLVILAITTLGTKDEKKVPDPNMASAGQPEGTTPDPLVGKTDEPETANTDTPEEMPPVVEEKTPDTGAVSQQEATSEGPSKSLGGTKRDRQTGMRKSRWDPSPDLAHFETTPPDMRAKIDKLIEQMFDPFAGRDSLDAKEMLIVIGKPAFPRILGRMAKARDEVTDVDSHEERLLESSLKLADETLRGMDGWLEAKGKSCLRPGSNKDYVTYICRLHYKRWDQKLKTMDKMPGPFDPSNEYAGEAEEYDGK
ncbi:MAG: hypothetical protein ACYSUN_01945 [Planctomycetota bacterium]